MLRKLVWKTMKSRLGFLAMGAGAMYLADPDRGRSRRMELQQRAEGLVRQQAGKVGEVTDLTHRPGPSTPNKSTGFGADQAG